VVWIDVLASKILNHGSDIMDYEDWEKWFVNQEEMGGLARRYYERVNGGDLG
jgi:hypothetical protein